MQIISRVLVVVVAFITNLMDRSSGPGKAVFIFTVVSSIVVVTVCQGILVNSMSITYTHSSFCRACFFFSLRMFPYIIYNFQVFFDSDPHH